MVSPRCRLGPARRSDEPRHPVFRGAGRAQDYSWRLAGTRLRPRRETRAPSTSLPTCSKKATARPGDTRLAAYWYRQAADQGDPAAQVKYETLSAQLANEAEH